MRDQALRVTLLLRKPRPGLYSVENIVANVAPKFPTDIEVRIVRLPFESRGLFRRLGNLIFTATVRGDVVHVMGDVTYCALAIRRSRCVLTILDVVSLHRLEGLRRSILYLLWYRLPVWWARKVIVISHAIEAELRAILPTTGTITVIPCPIADAFFERRGLSGSPNGRSVLHVGTKWNKNLESTIAALSGLDVELTIVGRLSSSQRVLLESSEITFRCIHSLPQKAMIDAYEGADALVFASLYEGFGLPIIEAQALGLPVITSKGGATQETAGPGALLVDPLDVRSIRDAVDRVLEDAELARQLVIAGRHRATAYRASNVAASLSAIYRSAAGSA